MRCRNAERTLALYMDERESGPLPPDLGAHLASCPACHDEWVALQQVEALFTQVPLAEPSSDFAAAVLARIDLEGQHVKTATARWRRLRRGWLGAGLAMGAALLAALLAGLTAWGLVFYGLSILVPGWLQDPQVVNTMESLMQQADFWVTVLCQTLLTIVGALLPWIAFGGVTFVCMCVLAYALTLAWGWLIGRVWWSGQAVTAVNGG